MSLVRVQNFCISLDGFGTGEGRDHEKHFGHAGDRLHEWMFATRWWGAGGSGGVDDAFARQFAHGDRKSTRLNSSHLVISYAVFCLKKKNQIKNKVTML